MAVDRVNYRAGIMHWVELCAMVAEHSTCRLQMRMVGPRLAQWSFIETMYRLHTETHEVQLLIPLQK